MAIHVNSQISWDLEDLVNHPLTAGQIAGPHITTTGWYGGQQNHRWDEIWWDDYTILYDPVPNSVAALLKPSPTSKTIPHITTNRCQKNIPSHGWFMAWWQTHIPNESPFNNGRIIWAVLYPSIIPFKPGWRSWHILIPKILTDIIPQLIINQQGFWTLIRLPEGHPQQIEDDRSLDVELSSDRGPLWAHREINDMAVVYVFPGKIQENNL